MHELGLDPGLAHAQPDQCHGELEPPGARATRVQVEDALAGLGRRRVRVPVDDGRKARRDRIEIMRSRSERPSVGMSKIPLKLTRGRLLAFQTRIGAVATTAVIDTGAQRTIGNQALRTALNRRQRNWTQEEIIGVTLDVERGDNIRTPPITMGKATITGARVTFTDTAIFEHWEMTEDPAVLLGMDVLGTLDVLIIDYKTKELHVRFRGSQAPVGKLKDTRILDRE